MWVLAGTRLIVLDATGAVNELAAADAALHLVFPGPALCCHWRALERRLGITPAPAFDVLELFAFVHPGQACVPSPAGLADALGLAAPGDAVEEALALTDATAVLLDRLRRGQADGRSDTAGLATLMARGGWPWAGAVLAATGPAREARRPLAVWRRLPEWQDEPPPPPPPLTPVRPGEVAERLAQLVRAGHRPVEARPAQLDYAHSVARAFAAPDLAGPVMVLAQAGTGIGKTLGYLAPASLYAAGNQDPVWISTYTRNLQQQIAADLVRLFPSQEERDRRTVIRKGRENYLCLLNFAEAVGMAEANPAMLPALGLMARWVAATRDGDLAGADFPAWLGDLVGRGRSHGLADRRGECIHSACEHYRRCFIERSIRKARHADLVIANHALVLSRAVLDLIDANDEAVDEADDPATPEGERAEVARRLSRFVFDEGHHLIDAADSVFAASLSGVETQELRRWLVGHERARAGRGGLQTRLEGLLEDEAGLAAIDALRQAAVALPSERWLERIHEDRPVGAAEHFLAAVAAHVRGRASLQSSAYGLEAEIRPIGARVLDSAAALAQALAALQQPCRTLLAALELRVEAAGETMSGDLRRRITAARRGLRRRALEPLAAWSAMLADLTRPEPPADKVDWFELDRHQGRLQDVAYRRHWVDPTQPLMATLAACAHGVVVTSATLADGAAEGWAAGSALPVPPAPGPAPPTQAAPQAAGGVSRDPGASPDPGGSLLWRRTGAIHNRGPVLVSHHASPYDYASHARVLVVGDVERDDEAAVAGAYRALFQAAGGGALGIFTAIERLLRVRARIQLPLEAEGIRLYAQHADGVDVATLVALFRHDRRACLLGTDAVRDGIDVPGDSLRLIVMERVPWPRPTILHRARRAWFGERAWDDHLVRLKLRQAFGRLIRRADDRGVFVLLDPRLPSRLATAFPDGVAVERVGLDVAVAAVTRHLGVGPGEPGDLPLDPAAAT